MIHCILTQNKLKVEQNTDVLPFQFSSNINIEFVKDDTYKNYVVTPYYAWVPTKSILPRKIDAFAIPLNDGVFTLPMSAFVKDGFLAIAFSLTDGKEVLQTDPIYLAVQSSVGESDILPKEDSWQLVVIDTVNQYIELNVNTKLQALIVEVARLNEESDNMQKEVNALVAKVNKMLEDGDFVPEHKWENTFLYFKYSNGEWDNGVNLKGPSGVYFGNNEPPEEGEFNVWVLPDGTPDFEINAEQVKTSDDSNVQTKLDNAVYVEDNAIIDAQGNQYGLIDSGVITDTDNYKIFYYQYADGRILYHYKGSISVETKGASGNVYTSPSVVVDVEYPIKMIETPIISISVGGRGVAPVVWGAIVDNTNSYTKLPQYRVISPISREAVAYRVTMVIEGRWK